MLSQVVLVVGLCALAAASDYEFCQHNGTTNCDCDFGWTGTRCDSPIDFCNHTLIIRDGTTTVLSVCGDHGTCNNSPVGANCTCDPGWIGPFCQENVDECSPNPCNDGATCVDLDGPGYYCLCPQWRTGKNCSEYINVCTDLNVYHKDKDLVNVKPCGDHGNCTMLPSGVACLCDVGYTGRFCETRIEKNCTHMTNNYSHGQVWKERCNVCQCHYGIVQCETGNWCPERCAVYNTTSTDARGITVGCKTARENCVPDKVGVECARENELCDSPTGWCFPVGYVMLAQPEINTPPSV